MDCSDISGEVIMEDNNEEDSDELIDKEQVEEDEN